MAIKASCTITISAYRDTDSVTRYYKLQASTASTPAKPTTLTPSGWTDSEPTYTNGSTNTLYFTDRSVFSDGTFSYSTVSKSSSYEAAKEAWNKAQAAQNSIDNLVIGGRNYIRNSKTLSSPCYVNGDKIENGFDTDFTVANHNKTTTTAYKDIISINSIIKAKPNTNYIVSFWAKCDGNGSPDNKIACCFYPSTCVSGKSSTGGTSTAADGDTKVLLTTEWKKYWVVWTTNSNPNSGNYSNIIIGRLFSDYTNNVYISKIKFEEGDKPTDWTPAPEDIENELNIKASSEALESERDKLQGLISTANQKINSLEGIITSLCQSGVNQSIMTQTSTGWAFNMATINNAIQTNADNLSQEISDREKGDGVNSTSIDNIKNYVTSIEDGMEVSYVNIGTDADNNPCVLLGKSGNEFRVAISNTSIQFMKNKEKIAYIDGSTFYGDNITAVKKLQIGIAPNNYYWEVRANGNLGLNYKIN